MRERNLPAIIARVWSRLAFTLIACVCAEAIGAAPLVLEESARIPAPDASFTFPTTIAVDGDWIIAGGFKQIEDYEGDPYFEYGTEYGAWLFRRQSNGEWALVRRLVQAVGHEDPYGPQVVADMHGGVAAILTQTAGSFVFERSQDEWISAPHTIETNTFDVGVSEDTIAVTFGYCTWETKAYRKATDGVWREVRHTPNDEPSIICDNEFSMDEMDIGGSSIIVASVLQEGGNNYVHDSSARIFDGPFGGPPSMTRLQLPGDDEVRRPLTIDAGTAVTGTFANGRHTFTRGAAGWQPSQLLSMPHELASPFTGQAEIQGDLFVSGNERAVAVFERDSSGAFRYAASLVPSDAPDGTRVDLVQLSGRRVVAAGYPDRAVYVFDLPTDLTPPALMQDTFEDGNWSTWTSLPGSQFSVATVSGSKVLRQTSTAGDAGAVMGGTERSNQAIEAEIKPTAFASGSSSRWFGLMTRFTDAQNYYYVTLRNSNRAELKKMVNGTFSTIAAADLPISLNRTYRVRLEAIGTNLRLFVDDELLLHATDDAHSEGRAGVLMYKAAAEFDNVIVSSSPRTVLAAYGYSGEAESTERWEDELGVWERMYDPSVAEDVYVQSSTTGDARLIGGIDTDDQVLQARIRKTSASGSQNWFGLATRYRDAGNYYYVTIRNTNVISLRKLVNGAIVELDSAPFATAMNTWYEVRFAAIGDQLRVYVNDRLLVEATDSAYPVGRYGPAMYRTAITVDEILAVQP